MYVKYPLWLVIILLLWCHCAQMITQPKETQKLFKYKAFSVIWRSIFMLVSSLMDLSGSKERNCLPILGYKKNEYALLAPEQLKKDVKWWVYLWCSGIWIKPLCHHKDLTQEDKSMRLLSVILCSWCILLMLCAQRGHDGGLRSAHISTASRSCALDWNTNRMLPWKAVCGWCLLKLNKKIKLPLSRA